MTCKKTKPDRSAKSARCESVETKMIGRIGAGNNPIVGMTVAVAVAVEEAAKAGKF